MAGVLEDAQAAYARRDYAGAFRLILPLAERGDPDAQFNVGNMYLMGQGVANDNALAAQWYRKAAEQGSAGAQSNLGNVYAAGLGVPKDDAQAVKWFRLAAEQGNPHAQTNLGVAYTTGKGVREDPVQALMWFTIAAAGGSTAASQSRDLLAGALTRAQVTKAERLARDWKPK